MGRMRRHGEKEDPKNPSYQAGRERARPKVRACQAGDRSLDGARDGSLSEARDGHPAEGGPSPGSVTDDELAAALAASPWEQLQGDKP